MFVKICYTKVYNCYNIFFSILLLLFIDKVSFCCFPFSIWKRLDFNLRSHKICKQKCGKNFNRSCKNLYTYLNIKRHFVIFKQTINNQKNPYFHTLCVQRCRVITIRCIYSHPFVYIYSLFACLYLHTQTVTYRVFKLFMFLTRSKGTHAIFSRAL